MSNWSSLFRSLTVDTLDTVDTVHCVNSVQSVDVSKGEEEENNSASRFRSLTADTLDSLDTQSTADVDTALSPTNRRHRVKSVNSSKAEQDVAILPPAAVSPSRSLTGDTLDSLDTVSTAHIDADEASTSGRHSVNSVQSVSVSKGKEREAAVSPLVASLAALERRRPDHIEPADWQHAVEDGRRFLIQWGERAAALGWVESDVFGLPSVPPNPPPSWRRRGRVDQLGLVWLTHGRPVTSITAESATIATPGGGSLAFYRPRARLEPRRGVGGPDEGATS
jgi:hypothetical protein